MARAYRRKLIKSFKRSLKSRPFILATAIVVFLIGIIAYTRYMDRRLTVDPASYAPLLLLIAKVESKDNYNAYFGNPTNKSVDFTNMTIAEVMKWQAEHVRQGNPSNAVGRYQIISTTLDGLVRRLGVATTQKFDQPTQDMFAIALLERRGAEEYVNKELTKEQFAANLAKEWAALPKVVGDNPNDSYYASDGLNKALVSVDTIIGAIEPISPK